MGIIFINVTTVLLNNLLLDANKSVLIDDAYNMKTIIRVIFFT
jgi:hypothetical protein